MFLLIKGDFSRVVVHFSQCRFFLCRRSDNSILYTHKKVFREHMLWYYTFHHFTTLRAHKTVQYNTDNLLIILPLAIRACYFAWIECGELCTSDTQSQLDIADYWNVLWILLRNNYVYVKRCMCLASDSFKWFGKVFMFLSHIYGVFVWFR